MAGSAEPEPQVKELACGSAGAEMGSGRVWLESVERERVRVLLFSFSFCW